MNVGWGGHRASRCRSFSFGMIWFSFAIWDRQDDWMERSTAVNHVSKWQVHHQGRITTARRTKQKKAVHWFAKCV
jgi:hypothetical protein